MLPFADRMRWTLFAACLWAVLAASRTSLESSMVWHMLVQLPLLAWIGYCVGSAWMHSRTGGALAGSLKGVQSFNAGGATGLLTAGFVMVLWMLPRFLDLARLDLLVDAIKFVSLPGAGFAVALSWPRCPLIARAVVHLEVIATLFRFGWGYLAADERLCLVYLINDQQRTGEILILFGAVYAVAVAWRPMFGASARVLFVRTPSN
jgi:hypothetical protein